MNNVAVITTFDFRFLLFCFEHMITFGYHPSILTNRGETSGDVRGATTPIIKIEAFLLFWQLVYFSGISKRLAY